MLDRCVNLSSSDGLRRMIEKDRMREDADAHPYVSAKRHALSVSGATATAEKWGDYLCDAPTILIESSMAFTNTTFPDPDFVIFTG